MRKKNTVRGCLSLGFLIHRHVCIEPMFFCPIKKPCGNVTARFLSIIILFRQRLPPVRLLIDR